jgi:hypothetical protein
MNKLLFGLLSVVILSTSALASEIDCQNDLRECFMLDGAKKTNCFYRVAENPSCKTTQSGRVAAKRWSLAGSQEASGANSLLGPSSADNSCLVSCDNQWLAFIVAQETPISISNHTIACLESCQSIDSEFIAP